MFRIYAWVFRGVSWVWKGLISCRTSRCTYLCSVMSALGCPWRDILWRAWCVTCALGCLVLVVMGESVVRFRLSVYFRIIKVIKTNVFSICVFQESGARSQRRLSNGGGHKRISIFFSNRWLPKDKYYFPFLRSVFMHTTHISRFLYLCLSGIRGWKSCLGNNAAYKV